MPNDEQLHGEVIAIVAEIAELSPEQVAPDAELEALGIDSLDGLRIVAAVEKRYQILIDEDEIATIRSMPDIFAVIRKYAADLT